MVTNGPILDDAFMTSVPGIFACGNVATVFDLVDYVSESGEIAARGASEFLKNADKNAQEYYPVVKENNIRFVIPQRIRAKPKNDAREIVFYLRVKENAGKSVLTCDLGEKM